MAPIRDLSWGGGELDACDISYSPWVPAPCAVSAPFSETFVYLYGQSATLVVRFQHSLSGVAAGWVANANQLHWRRLTNRKSGDFQAALDRGQQPLPKRRQFGRFGSRLRRNQIEAGIGR